MIYVYLFLKRQAKSNAHVAKFRIEQYSMQHSDKSQRRPLHSTSFTAEYVEAEKAKRVFLPSDRIYPLKLRACVGEIWWFVCG